MIGDLAQRHGASGPLVALAVATSTVFLFLGAVVAHADPGFVLTESSAAPGESVHFSLSGTDAGAAYSLEVDGEEVAEGTVRVESGVAGEFQMPDLGDASKAVTVEAQIKQEDESTTEERSLQYRAQSQASTGQAAPAVTALTPAPVAKKASPTRVAPEPRKRKRRASHRPPAKRRAARAPNGSRALPANEPRRSTRRGSLHRGSRLSGSPAPAGASAPSATRRSDPARSSGSETRRPSGGHKGVGAGIATLLTGPPTPAFFSLASGGTANGGPDASFAAAMVILLLGLTALTVAGGGLAIPRRPRIKRRSPSRARRRIDPPAPADGRFARPPAAPVDKEVWAPLLHEAASAFTPISLDVLEQRAILATRRERKYFLDPRIFERLLGELIPHCVVLEIDGARVFPYDTVYFDTPTRAIYRQHIQGRRKRFKCRTRLYDASGPCFFEVKMKGGRGETIKRRLELGVEEHGSLTRPMLAFLERELDDVYGALPPGDLAPALRTAYRRLTLVGRSGAERITFDFELAFSSNGNDYSIQPGRILLETKTDNEGGPAVGEAKRLLRQLGVRPVGSCSKYCLGLALAEPELIDNPFRPLMRRHFDARRHLPPIIDDHGSVVPEAEVELGWMRLGGAWVARPPVEP